MKIPKLRLRVLPVLILVIGVFASGFTVMTYEYVETLKIYRDSASMAWRAASESLASVSQDIEYLVWAVMEDEGLTERELHWILKSIKYSIAASQSSLSTLKHMLDRLGYEEESRDILSLMLTIEELESRLELLEQEYIISGKGDLKQGIQRNLDTLMGISVALERVLREPMDIDGEALAKLRELVGILG